MDEGRPAVLVAWIECRACDRIDKAAHDFNYQTDIAEGMELIRVDAVRALRTAGEAPSTAGDKAGALILGYGRYGAASTCSVSLS